MEIKRISAADTYPLRKQILRNNTKDDKLVKFKDDEDGQTFHLGAFEDGKLVSISSFYFDRNEQFPTENQFRLRGMATVEEYRGKGYSAALLKTAFPIIKQNFCDLVWCNARKNALGFYEKVGFRPMGEFFDIPGVGEHMLVYKDIS